MPTEMGLDNQEIYADMFATLGDDVPTLSMVQR